MWKRIVLLLALSLVVAASTLQAGPLNLYLGGSLADGVDLDAGLGDFGVEGDDLTWKIFAGLSLGRILGVEATWHDFGSVDCCDQLADAGFSLDVEGYSAAVVAGFPISRLRLFAKVGLLSWDVEGDSLTIFGPVPFSDDGEDLMGGVGVDLKLLKRLSVRAELELFEIADDSLDLVSVGIQYHF